MTNPTVNEIVAKALQEAGVPARNIELPKGDGNGSQPPITGAPKGAVAGEESPAEPVVAPEPTKPASAEAENKPLTKADIVDLFDQTTRKFQSIVDKRIATMQSQLKATTDTINAMAQSKEADELANLPPEEQLRKRVERLEKGNTSNPAQPAGQQTVITYQQLADMVDLAGLKIDDKRIDWAGDVDITQFETGYKRFKDSIKAALLEDTKNAIAGVQAESTKELTKLKKRLGVDKVNTSGASGKGSPDIEALSPFDKIKVGFEQERLQSQIAQ